MNHSDEEILLAVAAQIRSSLDAPDLDVADAISRGDLKLVRNCELIGGKIAYPATAVSRFLFGIDVGGGASAVMCDPRLAYQYKEYANELAFIEANRDTLDAYQIVDRLRRRPIEQYSDPARIKWPVVKRSGRTLAPYPYMGKVVMMEPIAGSRLHWAMVDETFLRALSEDIEAVVDLGCGAGVSLIQLALQSARDEVQFFGAEIAINGRKSLRSLAESAGLSNVVAVPLNFDAPDFDFLSGFKRVLVVSHIALTYGNEGCRAVWSGLLSRVPAISAALFEPVSFAIPGIELPLFDKEMARRSGCDPLLYPTLTDLAKNGVIAIDEVVPDMLGGGIGAALTLIRFRTSGASIGPA
jgi:hypothetical protein